MTRRITSATVTRLLRAVCVRVLVGATLVLAANRALLADELPTSFGPQPGQWSSGLISSLPPVVDADAQPGLMPMFTGPAISLISYQDEAPAPPGTPAANDSSGNNNGNGDQKQPLGQKPVDNSELFLRSETVLLQPGQCEMDYGFEYVWQEAVGLTVLPGNILSLERVRLRQWFCPSAIRFGWTERLQPFINIPWGGAEFARENPVSSNTDTDFGIGDVSAGFSYLLCKHDCTGVDVVGNFGFTAPTGSSPFGDFNAINNFASLGNGFWAISANVNYIRSIDPCVLFGGIGWSHEFNANEMGFEINPGEIFTYQFGMGFAVNDNITLSTLFQAQWQERFEVNNVSIPNSSQEPFTVRMAMTIVYSKRCIVEPFVRFGLDNDAPQSDFGFIITRRN